VPEIFIPDSYGTKTGTENWRQKMEWICGAGFWSAGHRYKGGGIGGGLLVILGL